MRNGRKEERMEGRNRRMAGREAGRNMFLKPEQSFNFL